MRGGRVSAALALLSCAARPGSVEEPAAQGATARGEPGARVGSGRELRPEEGGFSAWLPAGSSPPARSVLGDNHLAWEATAGSSTYRVEAMHAPGGVANPDEFAARMRGHALAAGRLVAERTVSGPTRFSLDLAIEDEGPPEHRRVELVLAPRHAFLLEVASPGPHGLSSREAERFFGSFRAVPTTGLSREVASTEGAFAIAFPARCGPAFKRVELLDGKVALVWVSEGDGATQCMVSVVQVGQAPTDAVFDAAVAGMIAALGQAVVAEDARGTRAGRPSRRLRLSATVTGTSLSMRGELVLGDGLLYQIQVLDPDPRELDAPDVQAFFASFRPSS